MGKPLTQIAPQKAQQPAQGGVKGPLILRPNPAGTQAAQTAQPVQKTQNSSTRAQATPKAPETTVSSPLLAPLMTASAVGNQNRAAAAALQQAQTRGPTINSKAWFIYTCH